ncbi:MAG: histidine kinase [Pseudomonadota bacterium]
MSNVTEAFFWQLIISLFIMTYLYSTAWKPYIKNNQPLDLHKSLLFWSYNLSGWSLAFLYISLSKLLSLDTVSIVLSQISTLSNILIGAMFGVFLRFLMHHYKLVVSSPLVFIPRLLGISMILGVAATVTLIFVSYVVIYGFLDVSNLQYFQNYIATSNYLYLAFFLHSLCFFVWSLLYIVTVTQRNNIKDEFRSLQLSKSIKEAQLNALSAKLDPHFIFNALDNIRTLIKVDSEKARESLLIFSNILRSPISRSSNEKIQFTNEIELVRNYVALIKIQFEERLNYFEDICTDSEKLAIPPMMLQIMVENAITHGISQLIKGGSLSLRVIVDNDQLICTISNTGSLQMGESRQGFGVGIKNIKERLQLLYGEKGMFNLYELGELVVAELILPVEYVS